MSKRSKPGQLTLSPGTFHPRSYQGYKIFILPCSHSHVPISKLSYLSTSHKTLPKPPTKPHQLVITKRTPKMAGVDLA